jgi:hypothetical protein
VVVLAAQETSGGRRLPAYEKNDGLYDAVDSLYERLRLLKQYLPSFGTDSPEYKGVSGLEIKKPGK